MEGDSRGGFSTNRREKGRKRDERGEESNSTMEWGEGGEGRKGIEEAKRGSVK